MIAHQEWFVAGRIRFEVFQRNFQIAGSLVSLEALNMKMYFVQVIR